MNVRAPETAPLDLTRSDSRTDSHINRLLWLGLAILAMGQLAISCSALHFVERLPDGTLTMRNMGLWLLAVNSDFKVSVLFASLGYVLVLAGVRAHIRGVRKWITRDKLLAESERFARS